jgi:hypothetical protein
MDEFCTILNKCPSTPEDIQAQNFARLTFDDNFHRTAANFAIGGETLGALASVYQHFKFLSAKWALNHFRFLHTNMRVFGRDGVTQTRVSSFGMDCLTVKTGGTNDAQIGFGAAYEVETSQNVIFGAWHGRPGNSGLGG